MKTIYVLLKDGGQKTFDENQVRDLLRQQLLTPEHLFWAEGMAEWRPLKELPAPAATVAPLRRTDDPTPSLPAKLLPEAVLPRISPAAMKFESKPDPDYEHDVRYKFRWMPKVRFLRLLAILADVFLLVAPALFTVFWLGITTSQDPVDSLSGGDPFQEAFLVAVILYYVLFIGTQVVLALLGRSVGKNFFGLRAVDIDTDVNRGVLANTIRAVTNGVLWLVPLLLVMSGHPYLFGAVVFYALIDALTIFYDDRCVHDYAAGTTVIQRDVY